MIVISVAHKSQFNHTDGFIQSKQKWRKAPVLLALPHSITHYHPPPTPYPQLSILPPFLLPLPQRSTHTPTPQRYSPFPKPLPTIPTPFPPQTTTCPCSATFGQVRIRLQCRVTELIPRRFDVSPRSYLSLNPSIRWVQLPFVL